MYQLTSDLCVENPQEFFINQEWINYFKNQKPASHQLIVGDLILRLLSNFHLKRLLHHLSWSLDHHGYLILRTHFAKKSKPNPQSITKTIHRLKQNNLSRYEIIDQLPFILSEYFVGRNNKVNLKKMRNLKIDDSIFLASINKWANNQFAFYSRSQHQIYQAIKPFFKPIYTSTSTYPLVNISLIVLQKVSHH